MAVLGSIIKQPNEILDFDIDYSTVLVGRTDTLTNQSAVAVVTGSGTGTVTVPSTSINVNKVKVVVSGGTAGSTYKVTVTVNTTTGLRYEDEVNVVVEET